MSDKFVREYDNPGAVINTDTRGLAAYKLRKQKSKQINELAGNVKQIDEMQQEIADIKQILQMIVEKIK